MKLTGAEYKAFFKADWEALLGKSECYIDDVAYSVDGVEVEEVDVDHLNDASKVTMDGGYIYAQVNGRTIEVCSPGVAFKKWQLVQTHEHVVLLVPKTQTAALINILPTFGAKKL